jgi:Asp-tRNA(Asn)/Glu-tRNA(Gln) amidotransferase A subunit family amidase
MPTAMEARSSEDGAPVIETVIPGPDEPHPGKIMVADVARLLDVLVGYDSEDPLTAFGIGHVPASFTTALDRNGLKGARIGIVRESMGYESEPESADFGRVTAVFDKAVGELSGAGEGCP